MEGTERGRGRCARLFFNGVRCLSRGRARAHRGTARLGVPIQPRVTWSRPRLPWERGAHLRHRAPLFLAGRGGRMPLVFRGGRSAKTRLPSPIHPTRPLSRRRPLPPPFLSPLLCGPAGLRAGERPLRLGRRPPRQKNELLQQGGPPGRHAGRRVGRGAGGARSMASRSVAPSSACPGRPTGPGPPTYGATWTPPGSRAWTGRARRPWSRPRSRWPSPSTAPLAAWLAW